MASVVMAYIVVAYTVMTHLARAYVGASLPRGNHAPLAAHGGACRERAGRGVGVLRRRAPRC